MQWTEDGSGKVGVSGLEVKYVGDSKGAKGNAILNHGGTGSWEFKVSGGQGTWVGVALQDKFGPGYGMKGLFYGGPGNLSDGSSLVTGHWGPRFGDGDVIGMRLEQAAGRTQLAYSKNGVGLGVAFDLSEFDAGGEFCPAVSMDTPGQAVTIDGSSAGMAAFAAARKPGPGIEGDWQGRFSLSVEAAEDAGKYRVCAKVGNSLNCLVSQAPDGKLSATPVMSTKMMPPPHLQELEQEVSSMLGGLTGLRRDGDSLVVEGAGKTEICKPADGPGPADKSRVNWIK